MKELNLEQVYSEIANILTNKMNCKWKEVYVRAGSMFVEMVELKIYVKVKNKFVLYDNLVKEEEFWKVFDELAEKIRELKKISKAGNMRDFTVAVFYMNSNGKYSMEYSNENIMDYKTKKRTEMIWKYEYLQLKPKNKQDKKLLDEYLNERKDENHE